MSKSFRLNRCLPSLSLRKAEVAIANGRVTVNGLIANPNTVVSPQDTVSLDGVEQRFHDTTSSRNFRYVKMWKPAGVLCTEANSKGVVTNTNIFEYSQLRKHESLRECRRIFTVGRLDRDSTGLILLTNHGQLSENLLRGDSKKVYQVALKNPISDDILEKLRRGVDVQVEVNRNGKTVKSFVENMKPASLTRSSFVEETRVLEAMKTSPLTALERAGNIRLTTWPQWDWESDQIKEGEWGGSGGGEVYPHALQVVLQSGRKRQVRKMMEAVGQNVISLHRTEFAGITLKGLLPGSWAFLSPEEEEVLLNQNHQVD